MRLKPFFRPENMGSSLVMALLLLLGAAQARAGTATYTSTSTRTASPTSSPTFTPLPTPNGLHVEPYCTIYTVAGQLNLPGNSGDGSFATAALTNLPSCVAVDSLGNLYFSEQGNHAIRKVSPGGIISRYAGMVSGTTPVQGYNGDGIAANTAALNTPGGIAVDANDDLYIADSLNHRVRKVDHLTGLISTVLGSGTGSYAGEGVAYSAALANPLALAFDIFGNLYVSENTVRVRKASGGTVVTVAGTTSGGASGEGIPAVGAQLSAYCLAFSPAGDLYIADGFNNRVRKVSGGLISTVFGTGVAGNGPFGGPATATKISFCAGIGFDPYGDLYVSDSSQALLLKMDSLGNSVKIGVDGPTPGGNGGPAIQAGSGTGYNVAFNAAGDLYFASPGCQIVHKIVACSVLTPTPTPTRTSSATATATRSPTPTRSATASATGTRTASPTRTATASPSPTRTSSSTATATATKTETPVGSDTNTPSSTRTGTATRSPTASPSATRTGSATASVTASPSASRTGSPTRTATASPSPTRTGSATRSPTATRTGTPVGSDTNTPSATRTGTATRSATATPSATRSSTAGPSGTSSPSPSVTATQTSTASSTATASASPSVSPTFSISVTLPGTCTITETSSATPSPSVTPSISVTWTYTPTLSPSFSVTASFSASPTLSPSPSITPTWTETALVSPVPTAAPAALQLFPNPFHPDRGEFFHVGNLPAGVQISIYNLIGETVYRFTSKGNAALDRWDGVNSNGVQVVTGVYILEADHKVYRLAVVRN